jgi:hypothetical protein
MSDVTFTPVHTARTSSGITPDLAAKQAAVKTLAGCNTSQAVRKLHGLGWSISAICQFVRYPTETKGHKAGDPLRAQHVRNIITSKE